MPNDESLAIGVDLGATKIAAALVTRAGQVLATRTAPTLVDQPGVFDRIAAEILALAASAKSEILGVGIGSPGVIDSHRGIVLGAVNMKWNNVPLADEVSTRCNGMLVCVENDACAAAVGEGYFGSAVGSKDYILLTIGSGLGSGVIAAGRLVTGAHSIATDMGHYSLDPDHGMLCRCGHVGCAETVCSGPGLVRVAKSLIAANKIPTTLRADFDSSAILAAAEKSDPLALAAIETLGQWTGHVAAAVGSVIDPDIIVIGGGLGIAAFPLIQPAMESEYRRRIPKCMPLPEFRPSTLASSALGSASLVWAGIENRKSKIENRDGGTA